MPWLGVSQAVLPDHCEPANDFLLQLSRASNLCIPTPLALISNVLGILSIIAWLFAQLPQIYKNWVIQSTSGLSIYFLVEWCLGDVSNLLGAIFTHQASWQVAIGAYYVFVDLCLVGQWIWYERLKHGQSVSRTWKSMGRLGQDGGNGRNQDMQGVVIEGISTGSSSTGEDQSEASATAHGKEQTRPKIIFTTPTFQEICSEDDKTFVSGEAPRSGSFGRTAYKVGSSSLMPSPSPRTVLLIACLIAVVAASPVRPANEIHVTETKLTTLELIGTVLAWMSSALYLGSRLPQLLKNWQRKSTAGLSPQLFIAAFCGNLFYSSALLTNPNAWSDFGPFGGGGWADETGNDRVQWIVSALPFFLGAAGVLGLDASVGVQFLMYGEGAEKVVMVDTNDIQGGQGREWRWRRVSGWMRGWIPGTSAGRGTEAEEEALVRRTDGLQHHEGYGAIL